MEEEGSGVHKNNVKVYIGPVGTWSRLFIIINGPKEPQGPAKTEIQCYHQFTGNTDFFFFTTVTIFIVSLAVITTVVRNYP